MKSNCCPCGSGSPLENCCGGIIGGQCRAKTAEQLMRSRYTAYVLKNVDYLVQTTHPSSRSPDLQDSIQNWMQQVEWLRLHIISSSKNTVEFIAEYVANGKPGQHHEHSMFEHVNGAWYYLNGDMS